MGIFGKLDKFDKLFKDRLGVDVIHLNYRITVGNLKNSQQNILKHFGWDNETIIFGINQIFNNVKYDVVCIGPPCGNNNSKAYYDYLTTDNFQPAWYHYSYEELATNKKGEENEWEKYDALMESLDSYYESLQAFFNFLDIYEKQLKVIKDLCDISNDSIEEIPEK